MLFAYEPALQPNADFLKAKLGDKVRLERFDEDGHALFVDDPVKFNRMVEEFVQGLGGRSCISIGCPCSEVGVTSNR